MCLCLMPLYICRFSHWRNETHPPAMQVMQTRFSRLAHEGYDRYNGKRYYILKQVHVCRVFICAHVSV